MLQFKAFYVVCRSVALLLGDMWPVDNSVHLSVRQNAAKQAAAAATQTIAAAQNAAASNKNTAAHQQLVQSCKVRQPGGYHV